MCDLVRQQQAEAEPGAAPPSPGPGRLITRLAGAVGAVLVGALALAALSVPPSTPAPAQVKEPAAPLLAKTSAVPTSAIVEVGSGPVDDGVPTATDLARAGTGHCHHGM